MAILEHSVTIKSHFVYAHGDVPSPGNKREHRIMQPNFWDSKQCARVEVTMGTHPTSVRRHMLRDYDKECPKSPCMLGTEASQKYREGIANTTRQKMLLSAGCALMAGAAIGVLGSAAIAVASLFVARLGLAMSWPTFVRVAIAAAIAGSLILASMDASDYVVARRRYEDLLLLSQAYVSDQRGLSHPSWDGECQRIIRRAYDGSDWALREAAVEYDALQQQKDVGYFYGAIEPVA